MSEYWAVYRHVGESHWYEFMPQDFPSFLSAHSQELFLPKRTLEEAQYSVRMLTSDLFDIIWNIPDSSDGLPQVEGISVRNTFGAAKRGQFIFRYFLIMQLPDHTFHRLIANSSNRAGLLNIPA